ncbi:MAG: DUF4982 domain-containing protein [Lachnospiraceae bacterium]|nr:DUF4982 domain-containing protein [Lachnospiraceae bacterium]
MHAESFNKGWIFYKEGQEEQAKAVTLPHDAMLWEERDKANPSAGAGAYFAGGTYIYEKKLAVRPDWQDKSIILEFEGVYQKATIWVNGREVGQNAYGYSNFFVPIGEYLQSGEEMTIRVVADNSAIPNSRWYSGSGIYRKVTCYIGNQQHIVPDSVSVDAGADGRAKIRGEVTGGDRVRLRICKDGKTCAETIVSVAGGRFEGTLQVEKPALWSDEDPALYELEAELFTGEEKLDGENVTFGFRTITWSPQQGLLVNGRKVLLRGSCVHHDNGILGAAAYDEAESRKVRIHKEAGFNAIRSAHNPCSKAMLKACDRYGIYVMDEFADHWLIHKNPYDYADADFKANWEKDLLAMIRKDQTHPCVILYSIGNEISELGLPEGVEMARKMTEFVKKEDPTRGVTAGINLMLASMAAKGKGLYSNDPENKKGSQSMDNMPTSTFFNMLMNHMGGLMDKAASGKGPDKVVENLEGILDINGYNYATSRYVAEGKKYPGHTIVGSETLPKYLFRNWQLCEKLPYLTGDFMWTGWDYLGEAGIGTVKYQSDLESGNLIISGGPGVIDICGRKRPEVEWNRMIWHLTDTPEISVEPMNHGGEKYSASMWRDTDGVASWTWPGCEGRKNKVRVYATGKYVELLVNGKSYGIRKTREYKAEFSKVEYVPGKIVARSYDAAKQLIAERELVTAKGEARLQVACSVKTLPANGEAICYVDIDLVGEDGITMSSCDRPVTVEVEGCGERIALGSARPAQGETFVGNTHTTYQGKVQAVIRAKETAGPVKVRVTAGNLQAMAELETIAQ